MLPALCPAVGTVQHTAACWQHPCGRRAPLGRATVGASGAACLDWLPRLVCIGVTHLPCPVGLTFLLGCFCRWSSPPAASSGREVGRQGLGILLFLSKLDGYSWKYMLCCELVLPGHGRYFLMEIKLSEALVVQE